MHQIWETHSKQAPSAFIRSFGVASRRQEAVRQSLVRGFGGHFAVFNYRAIGLFAQSNRVSTNYMAGDVETYRLKAFVVVMMAVLSFNHMQLI